MADRLALVFGNQVSSPYSGRRCFRVLGRIDVGATQERAQTRKNRRPLYKNARGRTELEGPISLPVNQFTSVAGPQDAGAEKPEWSLLRRGIWPLERPFRREDAAGSSPFFYPPEREANSRTTAGSTQEGA